MMQIIYLISMAIFNRCRGTGFYNHIASTTLTRLLATFLMAIFTAAWRPDAAWEIDLWLWAALFLWCVPAWDAYWSAEIGNDKAHSRLWGLGRMTIRQSLGIPALAGVWLICHGNPFYILTPLLFGLPYYIWGYVISQQATNTGPVAWAEYTIGTLWGVAFLGVIG